MTPVVWYYNDRRIIAAGTGPKKMLIRATPDALLTTVVGRLRYHKWESIFRKNGNTIETMLALIRECRRRAAGGLHLNEWTLSAMNALDPPPCACGQPGTRIVGSTTYCEECAKSSGANRLRRRTVYFEKLATDAEASYRAEDKERRQSEAHHAATGRRRRGRK